MRALLLGALAAAASLAGCDATDSFSTGGGGDCEELVWEGSVDIHDEDGLAILEGYTEITGDLEISNSPVPRLDPLHCLGKVGGSVSIVSNSALTSAAGLENLAHIGGGLSLGSCGSLTTFRLDLLEHLGGAFAVSSNGSLESLGAATLPTIGDRLAMEDNPFLESVDLGAVQGISSFATIDGNTRLQEIDLHSIDSIGGVLWISSNPQLPTCAATEIRDQLAELPGGACIEGNLADECEDDPSGC